jgi:electron transfer flavoprotein beta subunit
MANMRAMMPALQKARPAALTSSISYASVALPAVTRQTKIVKDVPAAQIAQELADWIKQ